MKTYDKLYINGAWAASSGGKAIDVINATTEEVMGRIPEGTEADANAAIAAARAAFDGWSQTTPAKRGEYLAAIQAKLKERAEELARTITGEVGVPLKIAQRVMVANPIHTFGTYAKLAAEFEFESTVGNSIIMREPVGVVGAITPWNFPLHQIALKVAAALAAGCTVVLKPSEVAPLNAFMLAEIMDEVKLPAGVFNLVSGYGPVVGEALAKSPDVDMVSFTGSTRAGKRVSELAAQTVKRVALELGGKSAALILDDADLAAAVKATVSYCYLNSGQTCAATTRMLVPAAMYEEAAKLATDAAQGFTVGDPMGDARLGPLISDVQRDRVRSYIKKGIEEGAQLLTGGADAPEGQPKGYFVKPTVFGKVQPSMTIAREEIFGPVLSIIAYKDEADAIRIANDSVYGLAGTVWSKDEERAKRVARRIRTGQIDINGGPFNPMAPFGGFKQSGRGREGGLYGMEEFLEYKSMQLRPPKAA
ncbi:MAG TPA: aldehyde dehydrogenase family protein [Burkholderiales bacterium]|nr:aldehyde dehydrogenase family protein [Burkholderiales bacterium]